MEENEALSFSDAERKFEFYDIGWSVEKFRLLLCKEYWAIHSPEFVTKKPKNAKWVMVLRSKPDLDDYEVLFILRRLNDDSEDEKFWVNFRVHVTYINDHTNYTDSKLYCFGKASECIVPLKNKQYYLDTLNPFKPDVLEVGCEMIVYSELTNEGFKTCSDAGFKSLSEDLLNLFNTKSYHDIALKFDGGTILAHEAMIYARCKTLSYYIEEEAFVTEMQLFEKAYEISLMDLSYEAMEKILKYLYSGDLKHLLEKPSVAVYDCATIFKIPEIKDVYNPEVLTFRTSLEAHKFTFNWYIINVMEKYMNVYRLSSPVLTETKFGTKWQLHLYPRIQADYVAIFVEAFNEIILLNACLEIGIADDTGQYFFLKVLERSGKDSNIWGYVKFAKRDLMEYYTVGGIFRVIFRLQLTNGDRNTIFERQVSTFKTDPEENLTFKNLSLDLGLLLDNGRFCDGFLSSDGVVFPIHKCILAARSSAFDKMVSNMHDVSEIRDISHMMKAEILCELLFYIYTGVLPYYLKYNQLPDLHKAAATFKLPLLRTFCARVFEDTED